jgi:hypothetical protein
MCVCVCVCVCVCIMCSFCEFESLNQTNTRVPDTVVSAQHSIDIEQRFPNFFQVGTTFIS